MVLSPLVRDRSVVLWANQKLTEYKSDYIPCKFVARSSLIPNWTNIRKNKVQDGAAPIVLTSDVSVADEGNETIEEVASDMFFSSPAPVPETLSGYVIKGLGLM